MNQKQSNFTKLIVITGGPGAGKTALLEMTKKIWTKKVVCLPEAASIVFGGGFFRLPSLTAIEAAQRAIFHVQNEQEKLVCDEQKWNIGLCDRGTLDGLAYWPGSEDEYFKTCNTSLEEEYQKYFAIIHLQTPSDKFGYNNLNPLRLENAAFAQQIDKRIAEIWNKHPQYTIINSDENFLKKAELALSIIKKHLKTLEVEESL